MNGQPIGVFDSGVGGLSILREVHKQLPNEPLIYLADQANVPYGPRPLGQVRNFAHAITRFLLEAGCKLIVVACNTASAAALRQLRNSFPGTPFVGMEPAVKPAAETTRSRRVAVLATPATFQGELFASVVERFAQGVEVIQVVLPGLVERIEAGDLSSPAVREILHKALAGIAERQADTLVLACTHYPFVIPLLEQIVGPAVRVIDPAPAIARQTGRLLEAHHLAAHAPAVESGSPAFVRYWTSGDPVAFRSSVRQLLGEVAAVGALRWNGPALEPV
jgi:glutamate racemase